MVIYPLSLPQTNLFSSNILLAGSVAPTFRTAKGLNQFIGSFALSLT